jgi:transposase-like protein
VFAQTTPEEVSARWDEVAGQLADRFPRAAACRHAAKADVLAFTAFPVDHWRKIWSNNPLERLNKEIKLRTNVVGNLPQRQGSDPFRRRRRGRSARRVFIARRYLTDTSMAQLHASRQTDPVHVVELTPGA